MAALRRLGEKSPFSFLRREPVINSRVVILGVWRLMDGQAGGLAHYVGRESGVLDIFSK
jgi:hypothetical protein